MGDIHWHLLVKQIFEQASTIGYTSVFWRNSWYVQCCWEAPAGLPLIILAGKEYVWLGHLLGLSRQGPFFSCDSELSWLGVTSVFMEVTWSKWGWSPLIIPLGWLQTLHNEASTMGTSSTTWSARWPRQSSFLRRPSLRAAPREHLQHHQPTEPLVQRYLLPLCRLLPCREGSLASLMMAFWYHSPGHKISTFYTLSLC